MALPPTSPASRHLPRNVLALSAVSLLTDVATEMIYPLLPRFLSATLGAGAMTIGAIEGAAESLSALLKLASGWWADRVPRRKPLVVAGYLLATVARPLIGLAGAVWHVFALRLIDRTGKGIRSAPRDAMIADAVDPSMRGRAFSVHRAADHTGALLGPLVAFALLQWNGVSVRGVILLAAIPGALAMLVLLAGVREEARIRSSPEGAVVSLGSVRELPGTFRAYLVILVLFTLGNSTDAFLLLRATDAGVPVATLPLLWAALHVVKAGSSVPAGILSDTIGRRPLIVAGWGVYSAVYFALGQVHSAAGIWFLFLAYGVYFGLTEGVEKALVADMVPAERRGVAYGWYNLAIGVAALPASLLFGAVWQAMGPATAFAFGGAMALAATVALGALLRRVPGA